MLLSLMFDYPASIVCFEMTDLQTLINTLKHEITNSANKELTGNQKVLDEETADSLITEALHNSVGSFLICEQTSTWDMCFDELADISEKARKEVMIGIYNIINEVKTTKPEEYQQIERRVQEALKLGEVIINAKDDPELLSLLMNKPQGEA